MYELFQQMILILEKELVTTILNLKIQWTHLRIIKQMIAHGKR